MSINQRQYTGYPIPQNSLVSKIQTGQIQKSYDTSTKTLLSQQNFQPSAQFDSAPVGGDIMQALMSILQMLMSVVGSLKNKETGQVGQGNGENVQENKVTTNGSGKSAGRSGQSLEGVGQGKKNNSKTSPAEKTQPGTPASSKDIDWGAPSTVSEDPNGAYQVPGGFEPPKGNEKADAAPGITTNPGNIQDANSAPDDAKSHSQAAGTKERHSMAQVEQMYGSIVDEKLAKYNAKYGTNAPREVILGIIYQESQGDPNTFGTDDPAESRGLMQVTAENAAREFPGKNQYNPEVSIETGVEAYTRTLKQYNGNNMQALAAYNQGKPTTNQGKAYAQWVKLWAEQVP